ncbi:PREDICTED: lipocalin-1 [Elephantulus edwardii]|uniref:lipocalin-1 n=1 Tax=Elephantulus edwardii TaxID=28737 RepID=UPI0003F0E44B|nr:PREDICTED: lipocalin-1 [Elephantulus edwardii]
MQTLFPTFVFGLIVALQAQTARATEENVSGRWYLKAVIADKEIPGKKVEAMMPLTVSVLEGGSLELKTTILANGQCEEVKLVLEKDGDTGTFTAYGGKRHVSIEKTHTSGHYILYCEGELKGQQVRMAKLVGRDSESNQAALEEFKEFVKDRGFDPEKFFIPKQLDLRGTSTLRESHRVDSGYRQRQGTPRGEDTRVIRDVLDQAPPGPSALEGQLFHSCVDEISRSGGPADSRVEGLGKAERTAGSCVCGTVKKMPVKDQLIQQRRPPRAFRTTSLRERAPLHAPARGDSPHQHLDAAPTCWLELAVFMVTPTQGPLLS